MRRNIFLRQSVWEGRSKARAPREAAAKTCRKMDSYMVKPKLPKVEEELDGGGNIPVPRELRNGKKWE